jgi:hypothetical protein
MNSDALASLSATAWRTSSYSTGTGNCLEITRSASLTGVRDSKHRPGGSLTLTTAQWTGFVAAITSGRISR